MSHKEWASGFFKAATVTCTVKVKQAGCKEARSSRVRVRRFPPHAAAAASGVTLTRFPPRRT